MKPFKVNLPYDEKEYKEGNGEGVFVQVPFLTAVAYHLDLTSPRLFVGVLDNDSVYYKGLKAGDKIPFELRGKNRPVVPIDFLNSKDRATSEEITKLFKN